MSHFLSDVVITGGSAYSPVVIKLWSGFSLTPNGLEVAPRGMQV